MIDAWTCLFSTVDIVVCFLLLSFEKIRLFKVCSFLINAHVSHIAKFVEPWKEAFTRDTLHNSIEPNPRKVQTQPVMLRSCVGSSPQNGCTRASAPSNVMCWLYVATLGVRSCHAGAFTLALTPNISRKWYTFEIVYGYICKNSLIKGLKLKNPQLRYGHLL